MNQPTHEAPADWRAPASPPPMPGQPWNARPTKPGHWVLGAGILFIVLGAFLPWASIATPFGSLEVSGMKGDGQITLVLGLILAVLGGRHYVLPGKGTLIPGLILASLVTLTGLIDASEVGELTDPGIGLILTILAGAAAVIGFSLLAGDRRGAPAEVSPIWAPPPAPQTSVRPDTWERWESMSQR